MTTSDAAQLPFDAVIVRGEGGRPKELGVEAFLAMPLAQRIQMILQRRVEFLMHGDPVDPSVALRTLRMLRTFEHAR